MPPAAALSSVMGLAPSPASRALLCVRAAPARGAAPMRLAHAPTLAKSAKGFGSGTQPAAKPAKKRSGGGGMGTKGKVPGFGTSTQDPEKIADRLEEQDEARRGRPDVRPVDPEEAKLGRIDRVRVKNWGSGKQEDMGDLQVEDHKQFPIEADPKRPFYEQLAMRLQLHQEKGELSVAEAKPLPPFERWDYGLHEYLQYLRGQQLVHDALESAVARASAAPGGGAAAIALARLGAGLGLQRGDALAADLALVEAMPGAEGAPGPDQMAAAYAKYIGGVGAAAAGGDEDAEGACLRLLSNVFCVQVAHLTTGVRVGAQAAEKLGLLAQGAVAFYHDYPKGVGNPVQVMMRAVNEVGLEMGDAKMLEAAMAELPRAMPKASLLLSPLAVEKGDHNLN